MRLVQIDAYIFEVYAIFVFRYFQEQNCKANRNHKKTKTGKSMQKFYPTLTNYRQSPKFCFMEMHFNYLTSNIAIKSTVTNFQPSYIWQMSS
jgi:hypothetical protein